MKAIRFALLSSALLIACAAFANDAPPSDASIQELTSLSRSQELFSSIKPQIDAMIASSMKEAAQGHTVTPERQAILDRMQAKMVAAYDDSFNAQSMQTLTLRIYQGTYTQDEVDGLIAFYKSPAGQALVSKGPLLVQNMMDEMRQMMRPMVQQIAQIKSETEQELKALPARK